MILQSRTSLRYKDVIGDHDQPYNAGSEGVAKASGIEVIHTPQATPQAHALCERFVGSLRRECLEHMLVAGVLPLIQFLKEYVAYFHCARPHQAIGQRIPEATQPPPGKPKAER